MTMDALLLLIGGALLFIGFTLWFKEE